MKTMEELYKEIMASEDLIKEFTEASQSKDTLESFLKKYECDASLEEVAAFLNEKTSGQDELDDDMLTTVAGGAKSIGNGSVFNISI